MTAKPLLMAEIVGAHGIKGLVKLKVFSGEPEGLPGYGALVDQKGKPFTILEMIAHGNIWLADIKGVTDRTAAEQLRGTKLYMTRDRLPELNKKNTWYHADLIGLAAKHKDGTDMGKVVAVANFGAGDLLEIKPLTGNSFYLPFTNSAVPEVNLGAKIVTIDPPPGLLD